MINKILRKEEAEFPKFNNHKQARNWFKKKYKESFSMIDSELINNKKYYFYHLILDNELYFQGINELQTKGFVEGLDFLNSHQPIQISEDGNIHIVY